MIRLTLSSFLMGEFAAAAVLISFCVVLGKLSILQLIIMALLEVLLYSVNEYIGFSLMFAHDVGYATFLHVFAASFGLGVSRALKVESVAQPCQLATSRQSNIFSLLGTLFLWVFWPSFMASASLPGLPQQRAMMNTYTAIMASLMATVVVSAFSNNQGKLHIDHIQNAVLAGEYYCFLHK